MCILFYFVYFACKHMYVPHVIHTLETNQTQCVFRDPRNTDRRKKAPFLLRTEFDSHRGSRDDAATGLGKRSSESLRSGTYLLSVQGITDDSGRLGALGDRAPQKVLGGVNCWDW